MKGKKYIKIIILIVITVMIRRGRCFSSTSGITSIVLVAVLNCTHSLTLVYSKF